MTGRISSFFAGFVLGYGTCTYFKLSNKIQQVKENFKQWKLNVQDRYGNTKQTVQEKSAAAATKMEEVSKNSKEKLADVSEKMG